TYAWIPESFSTISKSFLLSMGGSRLAESEASAESKVSEASKLTWHHKDKPATDFKRLSRKLADIEDKETALALDIVDLEAEGTQQRYKLLHT
ncbi:hypothetical protein C0991_003511, partial [Blastosporella zonata]